MNFHHQMGVEKIELLRNSISRIAFNHNWQYPLLDGSIITKMAQTSSSLVSEGWPGPEKATITLFKACWIMQPNQLFWTIAFKVEPVLANKKRIPLKGHMQAG